MSDGDDPEPSRLSVFVETYTCIAIGIAGLFTWFTLLWFMFADVL